MSENKVMKFMRLNEAAQLPKRATEGSAGYDLCALAGEPVVIKPGERVIIPTGLAVELPLNTAGMIFTRSGLGIKHGIHVTNGVGVIDWDYRGEIRVGLHNLSDESYVINPGERVAQLVLIPVLVPELREVESLEDTQRGSGGFGSTGT